MAEFVIFTLLWGMAEEYSRTRKTKVDEESSLSFAVALIISDAIFYGPHYALPCVFSFFFFILLSAVSGLASFSISFSPLISWLSGFCFLGLFVPFSGHELLLTTAKISNKNIKTFCIHQRSIVF